MRKEEREDRLPRVEVLSSQDEEPQVYALKREGTGWSLSRRNFLATVAAATGIAVTGRSGVKAQQTSTERSDVECDKVSAHKSIVYDLVISPDGRLLASGSWDNTIKLWSLPDGALLKTIEGHEAGVLSIDISSDGRLLASGGAENTIKLWSLPDGALLKTIEGHEHSVNALSIAPNGRFMASGSGDNTIKLWSLPDGVLLKTIEGHEDYVLSIDISPDGQLLASGGSDKTIRLWSLPAGELRICLMDLEASPSSVKGVTYKVRASTGHWLTYTLPCGSPIPPGAVCVCDCVPGGWRAPVPSTPSRDTRQRFNSYRIHYWYPN